MDAGPLREVPAQAVAAALITRHVDDQLQIGKLDAKRGGGCAEARAVVGVGVDLAQHGVENLLELLLCHTFRHRLNLNLRSTLPLPSHRGLDLPDLLADAPSALGDLVEQLHSAVARARGRAGGRLEGPLDRGAQRLERLLGHGQLHGPTLPRHARHMLAPCLSIYGRVLPTHRTSSCRAIPVARWRSPKSS